MSPPRRTETVTSDVVTVRFVLGVVLTLLQMGVCGAVALLHHNIDSLQKKVEVLPAISEVLRRQDRDIERIYDILERQRRGANNG